MFRRKGFYTFVFASFATFLAAFFSVFVFVSQQITFTCVENFQSTLTGNTNQYADKNTNYRWKNTNTNTNSNTNTNTNADKNTNTNSNTNTIRRKQAAAGGREGRRRPLHICTHLVIIMDTKGWWWLWLFRWSWLLWWWWWYTPSHHHGHKRFMMIMMILMIVIIMTMMITLMIIPLVMKKVNFYHGCKNVIFFRTQSGTVGVSGVSRFSSQHTTNSLPRYFLC